MTYRYTSTEDGQIVDSEDRLDYLEGLARWQVSEIAEIPESKPAVDAEAEAAAIEVWLAAEAEALAAAAEAKAEGVATEATIEPAAAVTPKVRTRK
ncbi:hypothetical protein [Rhodococcus qingshengii]|uniref:hypothetical protein n=1 Tax=Rhodococcus qingshengii TaxID=334542 RepID=UPI0035DE96F6